MLFENPARLTAMRQLEDAVGRINLDHLVGAALAASFLLPSLAPLLAIPVFVYAVRHRVRTARRSSAPAILLVVSLIGTLHVVGLLLGGTPYAGAVLRDLAVSACLMAVFLASRDRAGAADDAPNGFFAIIVPSALLVAIIALFKAALLERGILLAFVPGSILDYPGGSSLRSDYNLFGLFLLVGAIGIVRNLPRQRVFRGGLILATAALAILVAAAIMAGSRRTLLLVTMIPVLWCVLVIVIERSPGIARRTGIQLAAAALGAAALFWAVQAPNEVGEYVVWPSDETLATVAANPEGEADTDRHTRASSIGQPHSRAAGGLPGKQVRNRETDLTLLSTMGSQGEYGLGSRTGRWRLAWEIIQDEAFWVGIGFAYHQVFSCRFVKCSGIDYPHLTILSEWLIAGFVGMLAGVAYLALALLAAWRAGRQGWRAGVTPVLLVTLPSAIISGDTLLSSPQFLGVALLAHLMGSRSNARPIHGA
jgi:hypothetical protein